MRDKYIEETVGTYYLFPENEILSDIGTTRWQDEIAGNVPTEAAKALVEDRNKLVDALKYAINAHGEEAHRVYQEIAVNFYPKGEGE